MAKVWKDANEVIKMVHELPSNKLRELDKEMVSIPKFDKNIEKKKENLELSRNINKLNIFRRYNGER